jgi:hypothetical protein
LASTRTLYGLVAVLLATSLIISSAGLYFFFAYTQVQNTNNIYIDQLGQLRTSYNETAGKYDALLSSYNGLQSGYNLSLSDVTRMVSVYNSTISEFNSLSSTYARLSSRYNETLSLLASSVAVLNTTEPAYVNASRSLASLWKNYTALTESYRGELALFDASSAKFAQVVQDYETLSRARPNLIEAAKPIRVSPVTSDILLDFGNGTHRWYNGTSVQPGWNVYIATLVITDGNVQAQWYPSYPPHGEHFISAIDGVGDSQTMYWFLWSYNETTRWQQASLGADLLPMYNGSMYAWTFCSAPPPSYTPSCSLP